MLEVVVRKQLGAFVLDVAFSGPAAGVTALFGRSGAGKTATIGAVAGFLTPDWGHVRLDGLPFFDSAARVDLAPRRRRVGYVFQDARLFPHMRVRDNLLYGWRRLEDCGRRIKPDDVIDLLDVRSLLDRRVHHLSGGESQRVALGRTLLAQPRLLLMDEPLASLDAGRKAEILPYLERLRDEVRVPIVYVSHSLDEVARLADTLVVLEHGRVAAQGTLFDVMARLDLPGIGAHYQMGAVIECQIAAHNTNDGCSMLTFEGGTLMSAPLNVPVGRRLRVRILARDVLISTVSPEGLSALNVLPGVITGIRIESDGGAEVQIAVGEVKLVALITRRSCERLGLAPGTKVFAVIKTMAIDRPGLLPVLPHSDSP
jgi:molybdate transport system ATP-binding protein